MTTEPRIIEMEPEGEEPKAPMPKEPPSPQPAAPPPAPAPRDREASEVFERAARWLAVTLLMAACLAYALLAGSKIGRAYVDFGDGNYLYASSRIADGLVPYRDIMAPQPPLHLLAGAALIRMGESIRFELPLVRLFSIFLRIATALALASIARKLIDSKVAGALAGAIYLFLPNGLVWSLGYQSEPLEILFLAIAVRLILTMRFMPVAFASVFAAAAVFTNMTAAPYALFVALWLILRRGWLAAAFFVPFAMIVGMAGYGMEAWTGAYLENVVFNQMAAFPRQELSGQHPIEYALHKILSASTQILEMEGAPVVLALLGALVCLFRSQRRSAGEFLALFAVASLGSVVFVSKGGTMQYIFTIGEPYVAVFFVFSLAIVWRIQFFAIETHQSQKRAWAAKGFKSALILAALGGAGYQAWNVIGPKVVGGEVMQLSETRVAQVRKAIESYTDPSDTILAPPYFAYDSHRLVAGEYAEVYLWTIGYYVEALDMRSQNAAFATPGPATRKVAELASMLNRQAIKFVILDDEQTGLIPEIRTALDGSGYFTIEDFLAPAELANQLLSAQSPLAAAVAQNMTSDERAAMAGLAAGEPVAQRGGKALAALFNRFMDSSAFYETAIWKDVKFSDRTANMIEESYPEPGEGRYGVSMARYPWMRRAMVADAMPGWVRLYGEGKRYRELTELLFPTRDTPLRFFEPLGAGEPLAPRARRFEQLYPVAPERGRADASARFWPL